MKTNKEEIKALVLEMLNDSHEAMIKKAEIALNSGALDIDGWDNKNRKMVLPKSIIAAILESEHYQYSAIGTYSEKEVKKNIKDIRRFV